MQIGVPAESMAQETRVAATPETVRKLVRQGHLVRVQSGAGMAASFSDAAYAEAGAEIVEVSTAWATALVLKVRAPQAFELAFLDAGTTLVGMLEPFNISGLEQLAQAGITAYSLEAAPRTTRAQSLDVLSSQANVAGYKAVMLAADRYPRFFPMLMTAAGTVKAARVVVLGVGVAGLQAIATARRLGAVIEASDVRPSVKEQVESLGAKFIDVSYETAEEQEAAQGTAGYARPMPQSWLNRQQIEVAKRVAQADVVITTALIPGRDAPVLVTQEMVQSMKPGSVVVDLAAGRGPLGPHGSSGGNCPLTEPDKVVVRHGVTLVGYTNLPAQVAADASALYARNVLDFLKLIINSDGELHVDRQDDIVAACLVAHQGAVTRP